MLIVPNDADATMSARAAQGKLPDILQMQSYSRVQEYAEKGYLVDLTKQPVLGKVVDSAKPSVTWNGKYWGLPMDFAGIGIIYNKAIFAKYGIQPPATYRDLERICRTLRTNGMTPFAGLLKENWSMGHFITLIHTNLLAEKNIPVAKFIADMNAGKTSYGVVDTDKLFSVIDFYRANMDKNAEEWNWNEQQAAFAEGKAAMMVQGLWSYGAAIGTNPSLDCGFVPFPVFNDAKMNKFYADVDSCFGVSAQSAPDKKAAALKFLEWLATPQAQKIWVEDYKLTLSFKGADVSKLGTPLRRSHGQRREERRLSLGFRLLPDRRVRGRVQEWRPAIRVQQENGRGCHRRYRQAMGRETGRSSKTAMVQKTSRQEGQFHPLRRPGPPSLCPFLPPSLWARACAFPSRNWGRPHSQDAYKHARG